MKASRLGEKLLPENVKARIMDTIQKDEELLLGHQHFPVAGQNGVLFIESGPYSVSIEMELLVEELKQQHQDLKIQLETKVNYYEREIELMKRNFEKERKDVEQGFKVEISELEEQKSDLEELNAKCQEVIEGLKDQLQKLAPAQELERSFEKERSEMEQYYAKEISILGQRLAQERDKLEEDLKKKHEAETHFMRIELHRVSEENLILKNKLGRFQQEVEDVGEANRKHRKHIDKLMVEKEKVMHGIEELNELLLEANTSLSMAMFRHSQELEELKGLVGNSVPKSCLAELEERLAEEQNVVRQLQGELNSQAKQMRWQAATYQEEHENLHRLMEEKVGELEMNLKNVQTVLQEKVAELKEQFEKNAKSNLLLKDLYVENAQLMKTLQATEQRQKSTDNRNLILEEKISSLNKLVREITLASQ